MAGKGPVGVGIIGAGFISTQYLTNLTVFPDLKVVSIADIDLERAQKQAEAFGIPHWETVDELLKRDEIEIVVNLTIPAAHVEVARKILEAGKSSWTEKPFALDREAGLELLQFANSNGLRAATAPDTFLGAGLQTAQRAIERGEIGNPLTGLVLFQYGGAETWHPDPEFLYAPGGGPLFDMGPYYVTALVQNLGPVDRVAALSSQAHKTRVIATGPKAGKEFPVEVPTHVGGLLQFENGTSAQGIWSVDASQERLGFVEINGSEGTIVIPDPNLFVGDITLWRRGAAAPEVIAPVGSTFTRGTGVLELARSIRADRGEAASAELAYHVVDTLIALDDAARTGSWQSVESTVTPRAALPTDFDPAEATL